VCVCVVVSPFPPLSLSSRLRPVTKCVCSRLTLSTFIYVSTTIRGRGNWFHFGVWLKPTYIFAFYVILDGLAFHHVACRLKKKKITKIERGGRFWDNVKIVCVCVSQVCVCVCVCVSERVCGGLWIMCVWDTCAHRKRSKKQNVWKNILLKRNQETNDQSVEIDTVALSEVNMRFAWHRRHATSQVLKLRFQY
jgi:hypothetical protein